MPGLALSLGILRGAGIFFVCFEWAACGWAGPAIVVFVFFCSVSKYLLCPYGSIVLYGFFFPSALWACTLGHDVMPMTEHRRGRTLSVTFGCDPERDLTPYFRSSWEAGATVVLSDEIQGGGCKGGAKCGQPPVFSILFATLLQYHELVPK